jgi:hypothetical protein
VIFCGDLNDEPLAATTQIIQGPGGSEIDFRPGSGFQNGDQGDGWRMWNLAPLLTAPAYTRIYRGRGELIDHIFASHRLVNPTNLPKVGTVAVTPLPSMTDTPVPHRRRTTPPWSPRSPCECDQVWSSIVAVDALRCTDLIPFSALALVSYASLLAMISPLRAFNRKRNFPALSLYNSNFPGTTHLST